MFSIRAAEPADADSLGALHVACWREAYSGLLSPGFLAALDPRERALAFAQGIAWHRARDAEGEEGEGEEGDPSAGGGVSVARLRVAERDGALIGFALAGPSSEADAVRPTHLFMLYVLEALHGTGAGQALLDAVLGDAPAQLWVADPNPRAQAFYRRNGFTADGATQSEPAWEDLREIRLVR